MGKRHVALLEGLLWFSALAVLAGTLFLAREAIRPVPDGTAVVASIGLILTQTIALIGVLTRRAGDAHAEKRLAADVALRAIELIPSDDLPGTRARTGAATASLVELSFARNALTLLDALWPEDRISAEAAEIILQGALLSRDKRTQTTALGILVQNAHRSFSEDGEINYLPQALEEVDWWKGAEDYSRLAMARYVFIMCEDSVRRATEDESDRYQLATSLNDFSEYLLELCRYGSSRRTVRRRIIKGYGPELFAADILSTTLPLLVECDLAIPTLSGPEVNSADVYSWIEYVMSLGSVAPAFDQQLSRLREHLRRYEASHPE